MRRYDIFLTFFTFRSFFLRAGAAAGEGWQRLRSPPCRWAGVTLGHGSPTAQGKSNGKGTDPEAPPWVSVLPEVSEMGLPFC